MFETNFIAIHLLDYYRILCKNLTFWPDGGVEEKAHQVSSVVIVHPLGRMNAHCKFHRILPIVSVKIYTINTRKKMSGRSPKTQ